MNPTPPTDLFSLTSRRAGCWPDGQPIHDRALAVTLACGHQRVSRGWRGDPGQTYCCDACRKLTTIASVTATNEPVSDWQLPPGTAPADGLAVLAWLCPGPLRGWRGV